MVSALTRRQMAALTVPENNPLLGDLLNDLDFSQAPLLPLILLIVILVEELGCEAEHDGRYHSANKITCLVSVLVTDYSRAVTLLT